jgi:uncharacterized protein YhaN
VEWTCRLLTFLTACAYQLGADAVIGDDLLSIFDGRRTLAMLRLLATACRQRQIILFTHHRHVVDLALSVGEQLIDVIEI